MSWTDTELQPRSAGSRSRCTFQTVVSCCTITLNVSATGRPAILSRCASLTVSDFLKICVLAVCAHGARVSSARCRAYRTIVPLRTVYWQRHGISVAIVAGRAIKTACLCSEGLIVTWCASNLVAVTGCWRVVTRVCCELFW